MRIHAKLLERRKLMDKIFKTTTKTSRDAWQTYFKPPEEIVNIRKTDDLRLLHIKNQIFKELSDSKTILDCGCGLGYLLKEIYGKCKSKFLIGIDISFEAIKRAKRVVGKQKIFLISGACESLPVKNKVFDAIIFHSSLRNMQDPKLALENAYKCLISGGKIIIFDLKSNFCDPLVIPTFLRKLFKCVKKRAKNDLPIAWSPEILDKTISSTIKKFQLKKIYFEDYGIDFEWSFWQKLPKNILKILLFLAKILRRFPFSYYRANYCLVLMKE